MVAHRHLVQVRSTDLDWLGHVNNTAFPVFFQEARVALQHGWRGGLRHDEVDTVVERLGRTSFTYRHTVQDPDGDVVYAVGRSVMVLVDRETAKPVPLIDSLREHLAQFADGPAS